MTFNYETSTGSIALNVSGPQGPKGDKGDSYDVLIKDGYEWAKGIVGGVQNSDTDEYELYDRIKGVGSFYPGYFVEGYITTVPMVTPATDITFTQMIPIPS